MPFRTHFKKGIELEKYACCNGSVSISFEGLHSCPALCCDVLFDEHETFRLNLGFNILKFFFFIGNEKIF